MFHAVFYILLLVIYMSAVADHLCWIIIISEKQTMGCSHRKDMLRISIFIIYIFIPYFGLANNGTSSANSPSPCLDCVPVSLVLG